jgi:hypothetical protein
MPIFSKFIYIWPEGTNPIDFPPWIDTLTQAEQDEFRLADIRQKEFRKLAVDRGNLTVSNDGYIWKDKDALNTGKPTDPTWQQYWNRWQKETGVQFTIEQIEI